MPDSEKTPDPYAALTAANERIRTTATWLIASSAAVGVVMLTGTQLSKLGELDSWDLSTSSGVRLWTALIALLLAIGGVIYAIRSAVPVLLPKTVLIDDLADAWIPGTTSLVPVVSFFADNPKYLQGFPNPATAISRRAELIEARYALDDLPPTDPHGLLWHRKKSQAAAEDAREAEAVALEKRIDSHNSLINAIEQTAQHQLLLADFNTMRRKFLWCTIAVAVGVVLFAWAAYPPKPPSTINLSGAKLVGAYLRDVDLSSANLDNADLTRADLTGANLAGALIDGTKWDATTCPDGSNSNDNANTCAGHLTP